MKFPKIGLLLLLSGFAAILSACSGGAAPVYIEGDERVSVAAAVDPLAANIVDAIAAADYTAFTKDFDAAMQKALTQDKFDQIVGMYGKLGKADSIDLVNVEDKDTYYGVNYKVVYPAQSVNMLLVVAKDVTDQVTGLWFK